jgi:hypothetical protein
VHLQALRPLPSILSSCNGKPTQFEIPHRWLANEPSVLSIELARNFIPDFEGCACSVHTVVELALSRHLQPKLLLVLHRGQRPEMMV